MLERRPECGFRGSFTPLLSFCPGQTFPSAALCGQAHVSRRRKSAQPTQKPEKLRASVSPLPPSFPTSSLLLSRRIPNQRDRDVRASAGISEPSPFSLSLLFFPQSAIPPPLAEKYRASAGSTSRKVGGRQSPRLQTSPPLPFFLFSRTVPVIFQKTGPMEALKNIHARVLARTALPLFSPLPLFFFSSENFVLSGEREGVSIVYHWK